MRGVTRHQPDQEIAPAPDHMALPHLRPCGNLILERGEHRLLLAVQPDQSKQRDRPAQPCPVRIGMIAPDHVIFLQPAHAAQAWRGRNAYPPCQFHVRHAPVKLKFGHNPTVNRIKISHPFRHACSIFR